MCLLRAVALRFDSILNEALWLAYLDLKLVAVNPTYVSILLPQVTVARYTMSLARHSPSSILIETLSKFHTAACPM